MNAKQLAENLEVTATILKQRGLGTHSSFVTQAKALIEDLDDYHKKHPTEELLDEIRELNEENDQLAKQLDELRKEVVLKEEGDSK